MAELVDAVDLKSIAREGVRVQVPPRAPNRPSNRKKQILREQKDDHWAGFIALSFDHASSLGRELEDANREWKLAKIGIGAYVEKGHTAIFWSEEHRHGLSPLELVR